MQSGRDVKTRGDGVRDTGLVCARSVDMAYGIHLTSRRWMSSETYARDSSHRGLAGPRIDHVTAHVSITEIGKTKWNNSDGGYGVFGGIDVKIYTLNDVHMLETKNISARGTELLFFFKFHCKVVWEMDILLY